MLNHIIVVECSKHLILTEFNDNATTLFQNEALLTLNKSRAQDTHAQSTIVSMNCEWSDHVLSFNYDLEQG